LKDVAFKGIHGMAFSVSPPKVFLASPNPFLNTILRKIISTELGLEIDVCDLSHVSLDHLNETHQPEIQKLLLLIDFMGFDSATLHQAIEHFHNTSANITRYLAIFNVSRDAKIEKQMIQHGVHGIFYDDNDFELFKKGVSCILDGEIWLPRKNLFEYVSENIKDNVNDKPFEKSMTPQITPDSESLLSLSHSLTQREEEILIKLSAGKSNTEISQELFISSSTVKTHIYNIFQKIHVHNRIQAALWTLKHLKENNDS
jgi:LuxR family transcriptional regulator of csgAB operon